MATKLMFQTLENLISSCNSICDQAKSNIGYSEHQVLECAKRKLGVEGCRDSGDKATRDGSACIVVGNMDIDHR